MRKFNEMGKWAKVGLIAGQSLASVSPSIYGKMGTTTENWLCSAYYLPDMA